MRGHVTAYDVNETTSRPAEVTDRCGNKTAYEYDTAGRTTKVTSKDANGTEIARVSYAYDAFDNMTAIVRGDGMQYTLGYNPFHNLESIGVNGKAEKLVKCTYKNGNGRLKEITYANGDKMTATYNGIGQMIAEKWYNAANTLTAHYKYVYDTAGNIVRSIDILGLQEYTCNAKILCETWEDDNGKENTLIPLYDNEDSVCGIVYNGAWGKMVSVRNADGADISTDPAHIANINPYRYRGYYYDVETGLYYLQSRYYDAGVGRFINADDAVMAVRLTEYTIKSNLFPYCNNNPVSYIDTYGYDAILLQATKSVAGLGHTGLLFYSGTGWYYWYWGINEAVAFKQYGISFVCHEMTALGSGVPSTLRSVVSASALLKFIGRSLSFSSKTTYNNSKRFHLRYARTMTAPNVAFNYLKRRL